MTAGRGPIATEDIQAINHPPWHQVAALVHASRWPPAPGGDKTAIVSAQQPHSLLLPAEVLTSPKA